MYRCSPPPPGADWTWPAKEMEEWEKLAGGFKGFCDYWRDIDSGSDFVDDFPYELSLGMEPLLPFLTHSESGGRILVTQSYEAMFQRLLRLREKDEKTPTGAVLTGQPGTGELYRHIPSPSDTHRLICSPGKTTFLMFMLVRLISALQVVLFCGSSKIYLFYRGRAYCRPTESGFDNLPIHTKRHPIWALINMDYKDHGPPITEEPNIWPIQAASTNPVRWKSWSRQNEAALLGMPRWTEEELTKG